MPGRPMAATLMAIRMYIQSFDRSCLQKMLCMRKPSEIGFTAYRRRQNNILRRILSRMGTSELAAQLLAKHYRWAGHVARMHSSHLAAQWASEFTLEAWRLQQAVGELLDRQGERTSWRHSRQGRVSRWDGLLHRILGSTWQTAAQDRNAWKAVCSAFVSNAADSLLGVGHRLLGLASGG